MFDFDGTLVDSQWAITRVMAEAFAGAGLPAPEVAQVRRVVGLRLEVAIARLLPDGVGAEDVLTARLAADYRDASFLAPVFRVIHRHRHRRLVRP